MTGGILTMGVLGVLGVYYDHHAGRGSDSFSYRVKINPPNTPNPHLARVWSAMIVTVDAWSLFVPDFEHTVCMARLGCRRTSANLSAGLCNFAFETLRQVDAIAVTSIRTSRAMRKRWAAANYGALRGPADKIATCRRVGGVTAIPHEVVP
jgi:hypothetical protein